ncbi:MAG: ABC transporter permease [Planctomycetes bacterium]|nr:ABC transporter permease [Planctomycetota bacterium]
MNLFAISARSLRVRVLSTLLTTLSIALGAGLLAAIWLLMGEVDRKYRTSLQGYGAIVGPKEGAPLSLVLNTVFNLGASPGIVPLSVYEEIREGRIRFNNRPIPVRYAIPQARGDHYRGFPLVGTTDEMFFKFTRGDAGTLRFAKGAPFAFGHEELMAFAKEKAREHAEGGEAHAEARPQTARSGARPDHDPPASAPQASPPAHGEPGHVHGPECEHDHEALPARHRQAVVGAEVARKLRIDLGYRIVPMHGAPEDPDAHEHQEAACEVVGILAATGTPIDRAIYVPLAAFLAMDKHVAIRPEQAAEHGNVALSAVVVEPRSTIAASWLRYAFQTRMDGQVAWPGIEIPQLLSVVGSATDVLRVVSYVVLLVAAIGLMVALYNTMNERRREIAILRSLGARRHQIARIVLYEAGAIAAAGALLGVALCHGAAWLLGAWVEHQTGVAMDWAAFSPMEGWLILGAVVLGCVAGIAPAFKASRTPVADHLSPTT